MNRINALPQLVFYFFVFATSIRGSLHAEGAPNPPPEEPNPILAVLHKLNDDLRTLTESKQSIKELQEQYSTLSSELSNQSGDIKLLQSSIDELADSQRTRLGSGIDSITEQIRAQNQDLESIDLRVESLASNLIHEIQLQTTRQLESAQANWQESQSHTRSVNQELGAINELISGFLASFRKYLIGILVGTITILAVFGSFRLYKYSLILRTRRQSLSPNPSLPKQPDDQTSRNTKTLDQISESAAVSTHTSPVEAIEIVPPLDLVSTFLSQPTTSQPWTIGFASISGKVLGENEDYAVAFETGRIQFGVVADGLGGVQHGEAASYLAVQAVVRSISQCHISSDPGPEEISTVLRLAMTSAMHAIAQTAVQFEVGINSGLRTTLIICAGTSNRWLFGYSGDGGLQRISSSGEIENLLIPQQGEVQSLLTGSLGPVHAGDPVFGEAPRHQGDLLAIGSDGIWDRVADDFGHQIYRAALHFNGRLEETASKITEELSQHQDKEGFIFNDNLSLVLLGDGAPPVVADNFRERMFPDSEPVALTADQPKNT